MAQPIIGLTCSREKNQHGYTYLYVVEAYTAAINRAGGCPVLIPLGLAHDTLKAILDRVDGVLFTGGGDVYPEQYGSQMHPLVAGVDRDRDAIEIQLLQDIVRIKLPFLGICRGLQVINVAFGGTLYEDLLDQRTNSLRHQYFPEFERTHLAHVVNFEPNSQLTQILGVSSAQVNSLHHQGINRIAPNLRTTAYAPDGLIEAFELEEYPFGLAVQWHPEWLPRKAEMVSLFEAFIKAASQTQRQE